MIGRHRPDASVGALRGLPGLGMGEDFAAADQRHDDRRSVTVTSAPLRAGILVGGRPEVTVRLDRPVGRLVVRLTDVHPDGRSVLITTGVLCPEPGSDVLTQTAVRAQAEVCTNGSVVFARTWETVLVPECPVTGCR